MKQQTKILFYVLSVYVVLQFAWWTYYLLELSYKLDEPDTYNQKLIMIAGEGVVFLIILLFGIWKIRSAILKEIRFSKQQNNFLLSVTHELKTPLTSNKLFLQTLQKRKGLPREEQEGLIQQAIEEDNRLEEMINNILMATRIDTHNLQLNYERYNLSNEFTRIVDSWGKNRVPVNLTIEENVKMEVDLFVIQTILHNLLENAYKYAEKNPIIEVYLKKVKNTIIWGVKDNGKGIPSKHKTDIFKKFFRLGNEETRNQKGTGLGLYIVQKMVSFHHGEIIYMNNIPHGAHFKITQNEKKQKGWLSHS